MQRDRRSRTPWGRSRARFDERVWRVPAWVIALGVAAIVVSWWFAPDEVPAGIERTTARWALDAPDAWEPVLNVLMQTGSRWFAVAAVVVAACLARFRLAAGLAVAGSVAWVSSALAKHVVSSPRPTAEAELGIVVRDTSSSYGYPSAHTAISFALMLTLAASMRSTRIASAVSWLGASTAVVFAVMAVAVATGFARIYFGVHWLFDVVGGAGFGLLAGVLGVHVARRRRSAVSNQWV